MQHRRRRNMLGLGLAHAVALLAAGAASLLYARWLDAATFAAWAAALALARAGLMLLDGGLKTALVRHADETDARTAHSLCRLVTLLALLLSVALGAVLALLWWRGTLTAAQAALLWAYPAAYLLLYPPLFNPLARLERAQTFGPVARAEAGSVVLEFALPLGLLLTGVPVWAALAAAAWVARGWRSGFIVWAARALPALRATGAGAGTTTATLLREGLGIQALALLSMLRDHLHLLLVAPWFGAEWAGRYAFAFMACTLVSQVFVQTSARVSLPLLRDAAPPQRWALTLVQMRQLAIATLPALALLPALLALVDQSLWAGRWAEAVALLPWLVWRMLPSVATTPLGVLLLVSVSPWAAARAHAWWTLLELLAAALLLWWLGPLGLAVSAALMAWAGVAIFATRVWAANGAAAGVVDVGTRAAALLRVLLLRPSWWWAAALALLVAWQPQCLAVAVLALPLAWLAEPGVRQALRRALASP